MGSAWRHAVYNPTRPAAAVHAPVFRHEETHPGNAAPCRPRWHGRLSHVHLGPGRHEERLLARSLSGLDLLRHVSLDIHWLFEQLGSYWSNGG